MIRFRINKSWITGVLSALAININATFGDFYTNCVIDDGSLEEFKKRMVRAKDIKLEDINDVDGKVIKFLECAGLSYYTVVAKYVWALIRVGYSPSAISQLDTSACMSAFCIMQQGTLARPQGPIDDSYAKILCRDAGIEPIDVNAGHLINLGFDKEEIRNSTPKQRAWYLMIIQYNTEIIKKIEGATEAWELELTGRSDMAIADILPDIIDGGSLITIKQRQLNLGDSGAKSLSERLKVNNSATRLELTDTRIGDSGAGSLSEALKINSSLTEFSLSGNEIGDIGAGSLSDALKVNSSLTAFSLSGNQIGDIGAGSLSDALKVNSSLTAFSLSDNQIGDSGIGSLSDALKINSSLIWLNLSDNKLGTAAIKSLSELLKITSSLLYLDLSRSRIGARAALPLAKALEFNSSLIWLDLSENFISILAANALTKSLKKNSSLTWLDIHSNDIPDSGVQSLADALETNITLTYLNVDGNGPSETRYKRLHEKPFIAMLSLNVMGNDPSATYEDLPSGENNTNDDDMGDDDAGVGVPEVDDMNDDYAGDDYTGYGDMEDDNLPVFGSEEEYQN